MEAIVNSLLDFFTAQMTTFIVACLPIIELRGAIPIGIALGLSLQSSFLISFIGSILPIPFIFFLVRPIFNYLKQTKLLKNTVEKLEAKTLAKGEKVRSRGFFWGLLIFVAIPLPGTGIWSGTLLSVLLGMEFKKALPAVVIGDFIAGIIVLTVSYGAFSIFA